MFVISCENISSIVYDSFILDLWYYHPTVIFEITESTDFFQKTCFKESNNMAVEKNIKVTINFYKKECFPVITWNEKHSSKQVSSITYALDKKKFAAATFEGL